MQVDLHNVVAIDFETYYDSEYSLRAKAYNTSSYVRSPLFQVHCVSIKVGEAQEQAYRGADVAEALHAINWKTKSLVCQNTFFDGLILSHHFGIKPKFHFDTLSMARALHANQSRAGLKFLAPLYGVGRKDVGALDDTKGLREIPEDLWPRFLAYNNEDNRQCYEIFKIMVACFPEAECNLIDMTVRMFTDPILRVDIERAQAEVDREVARKAKAIEDLSKLFGDSVTEDDIQSPAKLAALLKSEGVEPPMKMSARTKLPTFAFAQTDDEFLALAAHENPKVAALVQTRLDVKSTIVESRAGRMVLDGSAGSLPVLLNYFGAHTGRWSGGNKVNMQNLPKEERDENNVPIPLTGELRKSVIAPPGHKLVVCDSKQIECRTLAYMAGQDDLIELFATDGDPYCALATEIYGRPITKANRDERAVGKCAELGLGFYMGAARFQGTLAAGILGPKIYMELEECQRIVTTYRTKRFKIKQFWRDAEAVLLRMLMKKTGGKADELTPFKGIMEYDAQTIWLPNGMGLHYPDIQAEWNEERNRFQDFTYRSNKDYVHIHSGLLTENLIQALARIIIGEQMLAIDKKYRVAMMTHDEIVCVAPDDKADDCLAFMIEQMSIAPSWAPGLPLGAEGGYDDCYSK